MTTDMEKLKGKLAKSREDLKATKEKLKICKEKNKATKNSGDVKKLLKAIRRNCLDCTCNQPKEIELCPITDCDLYDYRFGEIE